MNEDAVKTQIKLMKLQTGLIAGILILLLAVGAFLIVQVNAVMQSVNLEQINATVASLQSVAQELDDLDIAQIEAAITSFAAAADNLSKTDMEAINDGIKALASAAENLDGLDINQLNGLIKSLESVSNQMEKTTSAFSKLFGR